MDEILASIRKIISDQNDEADRAADLAVAEVANPEQQEDRIESVIGSVADEHWSKQTPSVPQNSENYSLSVPEIVAPASDPSTAPKTSASLEDLVESTPTPQAVRSDIVSGSFTNSLEPLTDPLVRSYQPPAPAIPVEALPVVNPAASISAGKPEREPLDSALERLIARRSERSVSPSLPPIETTDTLSPMAESSTAVPSKPPVIDRPPPFKDVLTAPEPVGNTHAVEKPTPVNPVTTPQSSNLNSVVAASFEQLATSMMSERMGEMDELMIDTLRPMLQEWMEDNLPSLVERLVREEIERVSRGVH